MAAVNEERVKALIAEALSESGPIALAISSTVAQAMVPNGPLEQPVHAAIDEAFAAASMTGGTIQKVADDSFNQKADAVFPFRAHLRGMTPRDFAAAWRALVVDPDHLAALSDAMSEGPMATIMALGAAHPGNTEIKDLKAHAAMRHAPKQTFKGLCLPGQGGGPDKLQVFLTERGESSDPNVRALARALLAMYFMIEKRFTVQQTIKKNGPEKAARQRLQMMPIVYDAIKSFKRRTTKVSASDTLHNEVLLRDFGVDILTALSRQAATVPSKRSAPAAPLEGGSSSLKRLAGAGGPEPASGVRSTTSLARRAPGLTLTLLPSAVRKPRKSRSRLRR